MSEGDALAMRDINVRPLTQLICALTALGLLAGCKVLTLEQDRQMRSQSGHEFDAAALVKQKWNGQINQLFESGKVPLDLLAAKYAAGDLSAFAPLHGHRSSSEVPWVFAVSGRGTVASVDQSSREGLMQVKVKGVGTVWVVLGPVTLSTSLRDSLSIFSFNELPDQLAYGAIATALNDKAQSDVKPVVAKLRPGMEVEFVGAAPQPASGEMWQVTPLRLRPL